MTDTALSYDPASYELQANPFPTYQRMLADAPLYYNAERDFWALTRFDDVLAGLNDHGLLSSAAGTLIESIQSADPPPDMMIFLDPPRHDELRGLVRRAFTPRRIGMLEAEVEELCRDWLRPAAERGSGEVVADLAGKLPATVIASLLGAPRSDHEFLKSVSDRMLHREDGSVDRPGDAAEAGAELFMYFYDLVSARRGETGEDMISALIGAQIESADGSPRQLDDTEIVMFCMLLGVAGNETTAKLIATGIVTLAEFPAQRARLVADPTLWPNAVEELLRFDPPSHYQGRRTTRDAVWHGHSVPAGATVLLVNGAANRDPRAFPDPDQFIADRPLDRHLAFGHGVHFCLGAALARLETRIALREFVASFPSYDVDHAGIERAHSSNIRGLSRVPFTAA